MQSQTKLDLVANNGDVQTWAAGVIKDYYVSPLNIQAGSEICCSKQTKTTVSVKVRIFKLPDSVGLNNSPFSAFIDYNAETDFNSIEEEISGEFKLSNYSRYF